MRKKRNALQPTYCHHLHFNLHSHHLHSNYSQSFISPVSHHEINKSKKKKTILKLQPTYCHHLHSNLHSHHLHSNLSTPTILSDSFPSCASPRNKQNQKKKNNSETDVQICFRGVRNGSRHPFH